MLAIRETRILIPSSSAAMTVVVTSAVTVKDSTWHAMKHQGCAMHPAYQTVRERIAATTVVEGLAEIVLERRKNAITTRGSACVYPTARKKYAATTVVTGLAVNVCHMKPAGTTMPATVPPTVPTRSAATTVAADLVAIAQAHRKYATVLASVSAYLSATVPSVVRTDAVGNAVSVALELTVAMTHFVTASRTALGWIAGMMVAEDHAESALSTIPAMKANVASLSVMGRTAGMMVAVESAANVDLEPSATVTASVNANQIAPISFVAMTAVVDLAENVPPTKPVMGDTVVNPNATEVTAATMVAAETVENVMVNVWMVFVAIQAALGWIVGMMVVGDHVENALSTRPVLQGHAVPRNAVSGSVVMTAVVDLAGSAATVVSATLMEFAATQFVIS